MHTISINHIITAVTASEPSVLSGSLGCPTAALQPSEFLSVKETEKEKRVTDGVECQATDSHSQSTATNPKVGTFKKNQFIWGSIYCITTIYSGDYVRYLLSAVYFLCFAFGV